MKNRLLLTVLAVTALMVPLMVRAEVKVLTDAPLIQDIGACCNPNGSASDPRTCKAGQDAKCGWMTGVSEGNKWTPPVPVTAFRDTTAAHEEVGSITVECDAGQILGNPDSGDYDLSSEIFLNDGVCNGAVPCLTGVTTVPPNQKLTCDKSGMLPGHYCQFPDQTGRWTSGSCAGVCSIDRNPDYVTTDGIFGLWFYNYGYNFDSACTTPSSKINRLECFRTDPADPTTNAKGTSYTTAGIYKGGAAYVGCEAGGSTRTFADGTSSAPAVNPVGVQCLGALVYSDDWVSGTLVDFVLPFGARLANTLYPGIQLEGKNQFDQRSTGMIDGAFWAVTYPAVVFRWEANHRKDGYGDAQDLPLPSLTMDRIKIFVPDILADGTTTAGQPSSYVLGEDLFDTASRIPAARDLVEGCYNNLAAAPLVNHNQMHCNYDTTICIDIRGADPVYRENSPDILARQVMFTVEDPLGTTYRPAVLVVAIIRARGVTLTGDFDSDATTKPMCDAYTDCYWTSTTTGGVTTNTYAPAKGAPGVMLLSWEEGIGSVWFQEKQGNYIQVDAGATTLKTWSTLTLKLNQKGVEFVEIDASALPNPSGDGPNCDNYVCPWSIVNGGAPPAGCVAGNMLNDDPAGCDCAVINTAGGPQVSIEPATGTGMTAHILRMDATSITVQIDTESGANTPAKIIISGYGLKIDESALTGGMGCVDANIKLAFPVAECANHVGTANTDTSDAGNPNQLNTATGAAPGDHRPGTSGSGESKDVPLVCITPGRTVLLYPYLVKAVGFDSGLVVTNTAGTPAIVHFYLYEEEGNTNIDTNPAVSVLQQQDPQRLSKSSTDAAIVALYNKYNEIPAYGQYVNLIFEYPGDPLSQVPKHGCQTEGSSGIFEDQTLQDLCSPMGRVWVYAVVEQCYAHGYQMVFSAGGFGSTLALVDQDTEILPFGAPPQHAFAPRNTAGVTTGTKFLPVHTPPSRWHNTVAAGKDIEERVYRYWNGNDE